VSPAQTHNVQTNSKEEAEDQNRTDNDVLEQIRVRPGMKKTKMSHHNGKGTKGRFRRSKQTTSNRIQIQHQQMMEASTRIQTKHPEHSTQ
jgi:hypothetical protein